MAGGAGRRLPRPERLTVTLPPAGGLKVSPEGSTGGGLNVSSGRVRGGRSAVTGESWRCLSEGNGARPGRADGLRGCVTFRLIPLKDAFKRDFQIRPECRT